MQRALDFHVAGLAAHTWSERPDLAERAEALGREIERLLEEEAAKQGCPEGLAKRLAKRPDFSSGRLADRAV